MSATEGRRYRDRDREYSRRDEPCGDNPRRYENRMMERDEFGRDSRGAEEDLDDAAPSRKELQRESKENPERFQRRTTAQRDDYGDRPERYQDDSRRDYGKSDRRDYRKDNRDGYRQDSRRSRSPQKRSTRSPPRNGSEEPIEVEKPCYTPSGLLARERNTFTETRGTTAIDKLSAVSVVLKYNEPVDAAPFAPSLRSKQTQYGKNTQFRLVCFKGPSDSDSESIRLDQHTFYLIGTDERIAKIPLPDDSRADEQHAVIQYRVKTSKDKYGDTHRTIKPYLIDLESEKGTRLNGEKVSPLRYIELRNKDMLQFGRGKDEYIFLEER